jgi:hypothetical protein
MTKVDRGGPFQGIGMPWVNSGFPAPEHAVKEIPQKNELSYHGKTSSYGDKDVDIPKDIKNFEIRKGIITPWKSCYAQIMHGEEDQVNSDNGDPEMPVSQLFVHHPAKHLGEPMVNARHHTEKRRTAHYQVEMGDHEIGVVQLDVKGCVPQVYPRQSTRYKKGYQPDGEQHGWCKPYVAPPQGGEVVENLNSRRHGNHQSHQHERRTQERVHPRNKHMVSPYHKRQDCNGQQRTDHGPVTENRFT